MERKVIYEDDNKKVEKNNYQYNEFSWKENDKEENRKKHEENWLNTFNGQQGWHGDECSKEDKRWGGKRWRNES